MRAWKDALLALILMVIPVVNIAAWIYYVTNAKRIAWQTRRWKSFQDFLSCQRRWDSWAKWWTVAAAIVALIWGIVGSATNGPQQQPTTGQTRQSSESALPPDELQKVTGNAGLDSGLGTFSGKLYNGGSWTITRVIIRVVTSRTLQDPPLNHYPPDKVPTGAQPDKQVLWNREFRVDFDPPLESLTTQSFSFDVTGDEAGLHYSWTIDEAFGQPPVSH